MPLWRECVVQILLREKGYDDQLVRAVARYEEVRPRITPRVRIAPEGRERAMRHRSLRPAKSKGAGERSSQARIQFVRPVSKLVEAVLGTRLDSLTHTIDG